MIEPKTMFDSYGAVPSIHVAWSLIMMVWMYLVRFPAMPPGSLARIPPMAARHAAPGGSISLLVLQP